MIFIQQIKLKYFVIPHETIYSIKKNRIPIYWNWNKKNVEVLRKQWYERNFPNFDRIVLIFAWNKWFK